MAVMSTELLSWYVDRSTISVKLSWQNIKLDVLSTEIQILILSKLDFNFCWPKLKSGLYFTFCLYSIVIFSLFFIFMGILLHSLFACVLWLQSSSSWPDTVTVTWCIFGLQCRINWAGEWCSPIIYLFQLNL